MWRGERGSQCRNPSQEYHSTYASAQVVAVLWAPTTSHHIFLPPVPLSAGESTPDPPGRQIDYLPHGEEDPRQGDWELSGRRVGNLSHGEGVQRQEPLPLSLAMSQTLLTLLYAAHDLGSSQPQTPTALTGNWAMGVCLHGKAGCANRFCPRGSLLVVRPGSQMPPLYPRS